MLSLGGVGMKNVHLSPCNHGVKEAATKMAEVATATGANIARKDAESLTAEARGTTSPREVLRHHHLVREAEAEDHTPAQSPMSTGGAHETHENV
jgi:hypothetical protein